MKQPISKRRPAAPGLPELARVLPEIQLLIEKSRQHVVSTANLTLVWLYWNVGRVVTQDIQKNQKRAGYGEQLLGGLAEALMQRYGSGYSHSNLNDMRRFFEAFDILQPTAVKSAVSIPPPVVAESSSKQNSQLPGDNSPMADILQPLAVKSKDRLPIDFSKHPHLGWTHYRILLTVEAGLKRDFYFQQAATQRWSKRELQRQIDRALFERVGLSRDTRALVRLERERGPVKPADGKFKDW